MERIDWNQIFVKASIEAMCGIQNNLGNLCLLTIDPDEIAKASVELGKAMTERLKHQVEDDEFFSKMFSAYDNKKENQQVTNILDINHY